MSEKYTLTNDIIKRYGKILYRIKSLKNFSNIKTGDLGGFIEKEENLSHTGKCWIYGDAIVFDNSIIQDDAIVQNFASVERDSEISGNTIVECHRMMLNIKMYNNIEYNMLDIYKPKTNLYLSIVYFNTKNHKLYFFNKESDMSLEDFRRSNLYYILSKLSLIEYVDKKNITDKEREQYKEYENRYYKILDFREGFTKFWKNLSKDEKQEIKKMPNFNHNMFYKISGIDVEAI